MVMAFLLTKLPVIPSANLAGVWKGYSLAGYSFSGEHGKRMKGWYKRYCFLGAQMDKAFWTVILVNMLLGAPCRGSEQLVHHDYCETSFPFL
jgi:hypothetical protein